MMTPSEREEQIATTEREIEEMRRRLDQDDLPTSTAENLAKWIERAKRDLSQLIAYARDEGNLPPPE